MQAGHELKTTQALVCSYEKGQKGPSIRTAFAIEDATGGAVPARSWTEEDDEASATEAA